MHSALDDSAQLRRKAFHIILQKFPIVIHNHVTKKRFTTTLRGYGPWNHGRTTETTDSSSLKSDKVQTLANFTIQSSFSLNTNVTHKICGSYDSHEVSTHRSLNYSATTQQTGKPHMDGKRKT
jgi:hypothetical protein